MIGKNRQLVIDEPVEVQHCRKITDRFRGIYRIIYPNLIKENRRMSTCNRLDLQTLGSKPIMLKNLPDHCSHLMIGKNRQLVIDEPVEVQHYKKITDHFRGIYRIYPNVIKENRRMSTCNRLDLQTLGSQPTMPKILPGHCSHHIQGAHAEELHIDELQEFEK
jgi:hypothetical protein